MSNIDKFLNTLGLKIEYTQDDEPDTEFNEEDKNYPSREFVAKESSRKINKKEKNISLDTEKTVKPVPSVTMLRPKLIVDAQQICDEIKSGKTVIVNVEDLSKEEMVRLYDFVSGVRYALEAKTMDITENVFIVAPYNVGISVLEHPKEEEYDEYLDDDVFDGYSSEDDF